MNISGNMLRDEGIHLRGRQRVNIHIEEEIFKLGQHNRDVDILIDANLVGEFLDRLKPVRLNEGRMRVELVVEPAET